MNECNSATESLGSPSTFDAIRTYEIKRVLPLVPQNSRILEIGAGTGLQARELAEQGFEVVALDVESGPYSNRRVWQVQTYDGKHIPFPDGSFDVIFTSSVIEHVDDVSRFLREIRRVLKPDGLAIHVVPSATWRLWTSVAHHLVCCLAVLGKIIAPRKIRGSIPLENALNQARDAPLARKLLRVLVPPPHGHGTNALTELILFTRFRWRFLMRRHGWSIHCYKSSGIFYSGHLLLGSAIDIPMRRWLGVFLGSSSHILVCKKCNGGPVRSAACVIIV